MRPFLVLLLAATALAGCATSAVYGTVGDQDDLYTGSATGYINSSGTIELRNTKGNVCKGDFTYVSTRALVGHGILGCDDGQRATIEFIGLTSTSGYGQGVTGNGGRVAFTYGMDREQSARYLGFKAAGATAAAPGSAAPPATTRRVATGSGFYIGFSGELLTNDHVTNHCEQLTATSDEGEKQLVTLVATSAQSDISLLRSGSRAPG